MPERDFYDEPPPLLVYSGVAPFWRGLAVVALLVAAALFCLALILGIALLPSQSSLFSYRNRPVPYASATASSPGVPQENEEDQLNPNQLPYPVQATLRPGGKYLVPGEKTLGLPRPSVRSDFLKKGQSLWQSNDILELDRVLVSHDGTNVGYVLGGLIQAGPIGQLGTLISGPMGNLPTPPPPVPPRAVLMGPGGAGMPGGALEVDYFERIGSNVWAWSPEGILFYTNEGCIGNFNPRNTTYNSWVHYGEAVAPIPGQSWWVVVRSRPRPKKEDAEGKPILDATEVVFLDSSKTDQAVVRTLIPAGAAAWRSLAMSPDGKQLALVSNLGYETSQPARWRLFLLDLAGGKPKPLTAPGESIGTVCWSSDGKSLIFDRGPGKEKWGKSVTSQHSSWDLFVLDQATGQEKPLSRGRGFWSPSMVQRDDLHFLAEIKEEGSTRGCLVHMPLKTAREIIEEQDRERTVSAKKWTELSGRVLKEAGLTSSVGGSKLSPESLRKLAEVFAQNYATLFRDDPPTTAAALENLRKDLTDLNLTGQTETDLQLILGAADGQYLERHLPGTRWLVQAGPLWGAGSPALLAENPFALVLNPFRPIKLPAASTSSISLAEIRSRVAGRTLLLGNDPAGSGKAVASMVDPALAQGLEFLRKNKGEEADRILADMLKRHERNCRLGLHVAGLLQEQGRTKAMERTAEFLEKLSEVFPPEPEAYNLLGLIWLPSKPEKAMEAFKNALRCDLKYGPAYLNLAQAYMQRNNPEDARLCLRRYLKLMPEGDYAQDARRRLATLRAEPGGPPNPFGGPAGPTIPPGQPGLSPGGSAAPSGPPVTENPVKPAPPSSPVTRKAPQ